MRTFLGGISKLLVNWHYYPKEFNIINNKQEFMMNSMVKSLGAPILSINNTNIQLEELYIDSIKNKKLILEILDNKSNFALKDINKVRDNYPEYYYIERDIVAINKNNCQNIESSIKHYLKTTKNFEPKLLDVYKIDINDDVLGLYVNVK